MMGGGFKAAIRSGGVARGVNLYLMQFEILRARYEFEIAQLQAVTGGAWDVYHTGGGCFVLQWDQVDTHGRNLWLCPDGNLTAIGEDRAAVWFMGWDGEHGIQSDECEYVSFDALLDALRVWISSRAVR